MGENRSVHWIKQAGAQRVSKSQGQDSSLLPPAPVYLNPYRPHTHTCTYTVIHLFICFWLLWIFVAALRLSLAVVSRSYSPVAVLGLPILVASLLWSMGSRECGLLQLSCMGFIALCHAGSSWTGDQTCVPSTGRQILNHLTPGRSAYSPL